MTGLLEVSDLAVEFSTWRGSVAALKGVSLSLDQGQTLALVGESGSGKSVTATAILGLLDHAATIRSGRILFEGTDLRHMARSELRAMRGGAMSMVFQNPRAALNPIRPILAQISDALVTHEKLGRAEADDRAHALLSAVAFRDPRRVGASYPHQLSGGMCQRAMIALAISCNPKLLIADEPTTGLDLTTQKQIMDLIAGLISRYGMSMLLITHDLGLAANYARHIAVMRHGVIVETGNAIGIGESATHAYTRRLIAASPTRTSRVHDLLPMEERSDEGPGAPAPVATENGSQLLTVTGLHKRFGDMHAVRDVSFSIAAGAALGLVGESGSGKSTISRLVCGLLDPTEGEIALEPKLGVSAGNRAGLAYKRRVQMVFQDPIESLNPRFTASRAISDPIRRLLGISDRRLLREKVEALADVVGLDRNLLTRLPHQLSGGQAARVGIARAIATEPDLLVLDEPTAALDVSIQALVLNLLDKVRRERGMSYLFVTHDLNVVRMMCDEIIVLREGTIVDRLASEDLFTGGSDYTRELTASLLEAPRRGADASAAPEPTTATAIPADRGRP